MKHRLYIVEGLPCSGKSSVSAYVAEFLRPLGKVCHVDEGTGDHPADYEWHAFAPAGLVAGAEGVVPLREYSGEALERLLPYKIYDSLPWETEKPLMLAKWRQFAWEAAADTAYVFNCVLMQNPMCETMMRFGFPEAVSLEYISRIAEIIRELHPVVIYLKNDDIASSVQAAAQERPGWLDGVIDYHVHGAYGISIAAEGFDGYIRCLRERQNREVRMLPQLPVESLLVDNPQRNWQEARQQIHTFLEKLQNS